MTVRQPRLIDRILPDLPEEIRDDFFVHAASELQRHSPWLFAAMFINALIAMSSGAVEAHWLVRYGLPGIMALYCAFSIATLRRDLDFANKPWRARKFLRESAVSSCIGAVLCTSWCVLSWLVAPVEARMHFPIILVMGGLATGYCLASVKIGAYANLAIDLLPISALMILSGTRAEFAAAVSLLLAGAFQLVMIQSHHRRVIHLLVLQKQARLQADTDPMTGLANRRALLTEVERFGEGDGPFRLMLIDIDHFKRINDNHGHTMGDRVLCELAELIGSHAPPGVVPARIGGEEFALFGRVEALDPAIALGLLNAIRTASMPHGRPVTVSIGVSEGPGGDETTWNALYRTADAALYCAKREGRNRIAHGAADCENAREDGRDDDREAAA